MLGTRQVILGAILVSAALLLPACRQEMQLDVPENEEEVLIETDLDLRGTVPTPNEKGLEATGQWEESVGAFRTSSNSCNLDSYFTHTADNAKLLWAMSRPRYAWSVSRGWARRIRDFLVSAEHDGIYYGRMAPGNWQQQLSAAQPGPSGLCSTRAPQGPFVWDKADEPRGHMLITFGVAAFSANYPKMRGKHPAKFYEKFVTRMLAKQHRRVGSAALFESIYQLAAASLWYKKTRSAEAKEWAEHAWTVIRKQKLPNGLFTLNPRSSGPAPAIRQTQVLWALRYAAAMHKQDGLEEAARGVEKHLGRTRLNAQMANHAIVIDGNDSRLENKGELAADELQGICSAEQCFAFTLLGLKKKSAWIVNAHLMNRDAGARWSGGWVYTNNAVGRPPKYSGTMEGNAMAWLADERILRAHWVK